MSEEVKDFGGDDAQGVGPWYAAGLRFGCTGSARCCRNHGDHTRVYLMDPEVPALARELGVPADEFRRTHTREEGGWTLLVAKGSQCVFLDGEGRCGVYEARPVQCRTWPFWKENIASRKAWERIVGPVCAGAGCGPLYRAQEIEHIAEATEAWYEGTLETFPDSAQVGPDGPPQQPL